MFLRFFYTLRAAGFPVSVHELRTLLDALQQGTVSCSVENFYYLCRAVLVKHEQHLDRFDKVFSSYFKGIEIIDEDILKQIPEAWLKKYFERQLTEEEKKCIEALGGPEALRKRFEELLQKQQERHQCGDTWIGTAGTSPFGAYGYNPQGYRMGQEGSRHRSAIKVWDKREFANLDEDVELDTRNIKLALRRLRILTREGKPEELDIRETIHRTSKNGGILDLHMVPSRKNRVKVLLLMDIGGSMDDHVEICARLFSSAKYEFKHLEYYYFHNCLYEYVWKDNRRRFDQRIPTIELLHKFNQDYKVIVVGDAAMSPYEITMEGGSVEHFNDEAGEVWLHRLINHFPYSVWINPVPEESWGYFSSTRIIREIFNYRMYPMTIAGISQAMRALKDKSKAYKKPVESE